MRVLLILTLLMVMSAMADVAFGFRDWTIYWTYGGIGPYTNYIPGSNSAWHVYGTPTVGTPVIAWQPMALWTNWSTTNITGTNYFFNTLSVPFVSQWFFTVVPTNNQGEYPLASVLSTAQTDPPLIAPSATRLSGK